jgi:uncharacterized protein YqjF (DUF2071 family)
VTEPLTPEPLAPEAVTAEAPAGRITRTVLTQSWLDLAFLHWPVDPAAVAPLLPPGAAPDTLDGVSYAGLIAFRMHRVGWLGLPGLPYLGTFPETNIRLYSVDAHGRRGVVFRTLEASRLIPVAVARLGFRLPYAWSRMSIHRDGPVIRYTSRRRWPAPRGAHANLTIRVGDPITAPSPLEHFLTARWGLHRTRAYLPNEHPRWPLHRATLLDLDETLLAAAGLPAPTAPPVSVLYSPGVPVRFGPALTPPTRLPAAPPR